MALFGPTLTASDSGHPSVPLCSASQAAALFLCYCKSLHKSYDEPTGLNANQYRGGSTWKNN